jgi:hypothetical protein
MVKQSVQTAIQTIGFYKENGIWYADLPDFLEAGLGTRANLMMVDGADTFLDKISAAGSQTTLKVSSGHFPDAQFQLRKMKMGMNRYLLGLIGHAPVEYGAYYEVDQADGPLTGHVLWLCPVTEYVFGNYPDIIHTAIV